MGSGSLLMSEQSNLEISPEWFATLFRHLWKNVIARQHEAGVLNSERALQAHLVGALSVLAPEVMILVEPQLSKTGIVPDLWVCTRQSSSALAVIELKYVPHAYPNWEKDLANLTTVVGVADRFAYTTDPATGSNGGEISCNQETLGIFAVVGRHDADAVDSEHLRRELDAGDYSAEQRRAFPRLLHAWGKVHKAESARTFDAGWLRRR
jgi:hypothetical protein